MKNFVTDAHLEALKEVLRWVALFIISWIITETLKQINFVPEHQLVKVWVFTYLIPTRTVLTFVLSLIGRYIDKFFHENPNISLKGLLPW